MITRKVQRVSHSTLVVSLPRKWATEVGLERGDIITFKKEEDGSLRLFPGIERERKEAVKSVINADLCNGHNLLTRILTGSYILGHDTIQVVSKGELRPEHLEEIRNTARRLTGIGIVEQTLKQVTIQSFIDPTSFPVDGLIRRLHVISSWMQLAAMRALLEGRPELAKEALHMEEEADRIYWLIVRQLLLAMQDKGVSGKIGLKSPRRIISNRVIAKCLEEMADYAENMAREILQIEHQECTSHPVILEGLSQLNELVQIISNKAMKALFSEDIKLANDVIETAKLVGREERKLTEKILMQVSDVSVAIVLRSIAWSLRQIARYCDIIAEITMNNILEEPSEICKFEKA